MYIKYSFLPVNNRVMFDEWAPRYDVSNRYVGTVYGCTLGTSRRTCKIKNKHYTYTTAPNVLP
jgi:hypothetical protein